MSDNIQLPKLLCNSSDFEEGPKFNAAAFQEKVPGEAEDAEDTGNHGIFESDHCEL